MPLPVNSQRMTSPAKFQARLSPRPSPICDATNARPDREERQRDRPSVMRGRQKGRAVASLHTLYYIEFIYS